MLEDFLASAAAQRLRACAVGVDLDALCVRLARLGYSHTTIHLKLWIIGCLMRWMTDKHVAIVELDAQRVDEFLKVRQRRGRVCRVIALWLGHESIETTQIYLHADLRLKEKALARTAPSGKAPGRYLPRRRTSDLPGGPPIISRPAVGPYQRSVAVDAPPTTEAG